MTTIVNSKFEAQLIPLRGVVWRSARLRVSFSLLLKTGCLTYNLPGLDKARQFLDDW